MIVQTIVEGHGEVAGLPVLLRRLAAHVEFPRPIRIPHGKLVKHDEFTRAIQLAAMYAGPDDAILVVLDADEQCPAQLGPRLLGWAAAARADRRCAVVIAKNEFEAWFIAGADPLHGAGKLAAGTTTNLDPEGLRDAKGWLSERMGRRYSETIDQPAFAATFDLHAARTRSPSFDKLCRDVNRLIAI